MTTTKETIKSVGEAFYRSGRPVDVISPDGWHMLLWNSGAGVACAGMWQEGESIVEHEWSTHLDGWNYCTFTSTAAMVRDVVRSIRDEGYRIESINSGRYNR